MGAITVEASVEGGSMIRSTPYGLVDEGPSRARPRTETGKLPRGFHLEPVLSAKERDRKRARERRELARIERQLAA